MVGGFGMPGFIPSRRSLLFALITVLALSSLLNEVQGSVEACLDYMKVIDCWRLHAKVPDCEESESPLVKCSREWGKSVFEGCDDGNYTEITKIAMDIYHERDRSLCAYYRMRRVFSLDNTCWLEAKSCVQDITFVLPRDLPYDCKEKNERLEECKKDKPKQCVYWIDKLAKYMFRASPCRGSIVTYHMTLILMTSLVAVFHSAFLNG